MAFFPFRRFAPPDIRREGSPLFTRFVFDRRKSGEPASSTERLTLMEAMKRGVAFFRVEPFSYLSRACLVKDERNLSPGRSGESAGAAAEKF